jgi:hypothetical protein
LAHMSDWQSLPILPPPLVARQLDDDGVEIRAPEIAPASFELVPATTLTERLVDQITRRAATQERPILVTYARASAQARAALREAGVCYAGGDGRLFLRAPGLYIERDDRAATSPRADWDEFEPDVSSDTRNPFAVRSSRVPRWLLLHHRRPFAVSEIANAVALHPSVVSRVLSGLEDAALIGEATPASGDSRRREVTITQPRALLERWAPRWQRRRIRERSWDIGARDADDALRLLAEARAEQPDAAWAVGGVAGAATLRRAVEPADVMLWTRAEQVSTLGDLLQAGPARRRGGRGPLRIAVTPDPWVLSLAQHEPLPIVDPVQLWLDCATEGERALEAADAVAQAVGW